jgi:hypothetical protein
LTLGNSGVTFYCMKNITVYEVVAGSRTNPGKVLKTFTSGESHKCGGPATACLRAWDKMKRGGVQAFFRKAA